MPQGFTRPWFSLVFSRVTHDRLSERRTPCSLHAYPTRAREIVVNSVVNYSVI